jgi:amino acid permease
MIIVLLSIIIFIIIVFSIFFSIKSNNKKPIETNYELIEIEINKLYKNNFLQVIDPEKLHDIKLASFLDPVQQSNYKYIINVDGHVSAFRLS